jgi:hypothetical protein
VEDFSSAGLIGALVGLIVGWIDYKVVGGFIERRLRATDRSTTAAEKADYERRIGWFRRIWFVATVVAFPFAGYWLGRAIAG